jgi:hypothetical protein
MARIAVFAPDRYKEEGDSTGHHFQRQSVVEEGGIEGEHIGNILAHKGGTYCCTSSLRKNQPPE